MSLFYFLNKSSLVISKWQCVIIMINSFELTDKCPQAIQIIWWNEHFEIPHLQIIATQQMLTSSRMRSKWKCTLCANYCWKIDIQIKLTFFLSFLKEFTVSREYKTICNLKKNEIARITELKKCVSGNDTSMLSFLVVSVVLKHYRLKILYMK